MCSLVLEHVRDQFGPSPVHTDMRLFSTSLRIICFTSLALAMGLGACSADPDDTAEFQDLAAELADHVGAEDYQVVRLDDEFVVPAPGDDTDVPPSASLPDELVSDDEPLMACRLTGWIGHSQVCQVCSVDWIWWGCVESVSCFDGGATTYRVCER
ncbi:MAG: hypothetical protein IPN32_06670 [Deltaproteobacteria bacterium]|nr:hypothetical protein [Deltaproteobacteria bacterium]